MTNYTTTRRTLPVLSHRITLLTLLFSIGFLWVSAPSLSSQSTSAQSLWRSEAPLLEPRSNAAVAGLITSEGPSLFLFLGLDSTKLWSGVSNRAFRWNVDSGSGWTEIESVPGDGRLASTAQVVGGKVYLFGGYTVASNRAEKSLPNVDILDPETGRWSQGAPIPVPVDDAVSGILGPDSLVYLVSGWHDRGNETLVQIYDPANDSWRQATEILGEPVFGHTGAIAGNSIVYVDGVKVVAGRPPYQLEPSSWIGEIDPNSPEQVSWSRLPDHPGAGIYRGAGLSVEDWVLFLGGTDNPYNYNGVGYNGVPAVPSSRILGFDATNRTWAEMTSLPQPSMDHRNAVVVGGRVYLIGGMEADQTVTNAVYSISLEDLLGSAEGAGG